MQYVKQGMPYLSYRDLWYLRRTGMCNVIHFPFTVNVYQLKWTASLLWITNHKASSAWKIKWSVQVYWMLLNYTRVSGTAATGSSPVQFGATSYTADSDPYWANLCEVLWRWSQYLDCFKMKKTSKPLRQEHVLRSLQQHSEWHDSD